MEKRRRVINADLIKTLSLAGCKILENEPMSKRCSFKIGGGADFFVEIPTEKALLVFLQNIGEENFFILGGATNILFSDNGYRGAIVKLTEEFAQFSIKGNAVTCGAGASLPLVVKAAAENNLSGFESLAGIPGTVGGAVLGNAGSAAKWISNSVESVEVFRNAKKELLKREEIVFEYRSSNLKNVVITKINFTLKKAAGNDILKEISESINRRAQSQPLNTPNAGCIFKNPKDASAGKLIDESGLKGKSYGGAKISEIHANFIVNTGAAKADDVLYLAELAKKTVKEKFNINLEYEIKIIK
ncbi:UDP-N-acetylmuramate dehydrogenase [Endomicrobium proavitum]|uniref:UDP-N-acetylenolpyruvoylglucosamine reductase n=1 Tax=Endomicrobium proavitum TaxID=1408281 RepID=A0A0G3WK80_9BACT|nr:UDP-N-acetylmuramate dehydrogenase [Endomicrobium proavitum]AKL98305.1 UDP-N-acetylenolpyruvoylglucosamine reductase [Endomicrobium proavitum]